MSARTVSTPWLTAVLRLSVALLISLVVGSAVAQNNIAPGQTGQFAATGTDMPTGGILWQVVNSSGTQVASVNAANGWSVSYSQASGLLTVSVPTNAAVGNNYEARYFSTNIRPIQPHSGFFNVTGGPAPYSLTATAGNSSVALSWDIYFPVTNGQGFNIKRSTTSGGPYTTIYSGQVPMVNPIGFNFAECSYTDSSVVNGTTYYYVVSAVYSAGESANSNQASATPYGAPLAPAWLTATAGNAQVLLNWAPTFNSTAYNVYRSTTSGGPYTKIATGVTNPNQQYTDTGLTNGTTYYYVVTATNSYGESPYSPQAMATPEPPPPPPPTGLTAAASSYQVLLSWTASPGATSYNVKRSLTNGGPYTTVATGVAAVSYTDTGLTNGTTYYYVVTAVNGGGESAPSNQASATPQGPPNAPTNLTASPSDKQVAVAWWASPNATSYNVKRSLTSGGPYTTIASAVTATSYLDTGLTDGTTYYYVVTGVDASGESPNSNQASATPQQPTSPPPAPTNLTATPGDTIVNLAWNASATASGYNVKRSLVSGGPYTTIATGVAATGYTDTGLTDGTTYYYVVSATNSKGESPNSNEAHATPEPPAPPAPTNLNAYPGNQLVHLTWNSSSGATSYSVWRSTTSGGPYSLMAHGLAATAYTDTGLTNYVTYYYLVTASNSGGTSPNSNEAHATPTPARVPIGIMPVGPNGYPQDALTLPAWMEDTIPTDESDEPGDGSASPLSINLAFGVVDLDTGPDIVMQDQNAGSISWELRYRTMLAAAQYSSPGLAPGWTHNWDYRIAPLNPGTLGSVVLIYPNGASETLNPTQTVTGGATQFTQPGGAPYVPFGFPNSGNTGWSAISLNGNGLAKMNFTQASGDAFYRLTSVQLDTGSIINLTYSAQGQLTNIQSQDPNNVPTNKHIYMVYSGGLLSYVNCGDTEQDYGYAGGELSYVLNQNANLHMWDYRYAYFNGAPYISSVDTIYGSGIQSVVNYDPATGRALSLTDSVGNLRSYGYTDNVSTQVSVSTGSSTTNSWKKGFDASGRTIAVTSAAGNTTSLAYSTTNPGGLAAIQTPTAGTVTITRDVNGNPTQIKYPYGNGVNIAWDYGTPPSTYPLGRVTQTQEFGSDNSLKKPTSYSYYPITNGSGSFAGYLNSVTFPNGATEYAYTPLGNVQTVTGPAADGTASTSTYIYTDGNPNDAELYGKPYGIKDPLGNLTQMMYSSAAWTGTADALGNTVTGAFNSYDQLTSLSLPLGQGMTLSYSLAPGKHPTAVSLNGNGLEQLNSDNELATTQTSGLASPTSYLTLDPQFNLTGLTNGNNRQMHAFTLDPFHSHLQYTVAPGSAGQAVFDRYFNANGNLSSYNDPSITGSIIRNPTGDFVSAINVTDTGSDFFDINYTYDVFGRVATEYTNTSYFGSAAQHTYHYDDEDHVIEDQCVTNAYTSDINYVYAPNGARTQMTVSVTTNGHGAYLSYYYYYDHNGNLTDINVNDPNGSTAGIAPHYDYDADNRVIAARTPLASTCYVYDGLGRLTNLFNYTADNVVDDPTTKVTDYYKPTVVHSIFSTFTNLSYDSLNNLDAMNFMVRGKVANLTGSYSQGSVTYTFGGYANSLTNETWTLSNGTSASLNYYTDNGGNLTSVRGNTFGVDSSSDELTGGYYPSPTYSASGLRIPTNPNTVSELKANADSA